MELSLWEGVRLCGTLARESVGVSGRLAFWCLSEGVVFGWREVLTWSDMPLYLVGNKHARRKNPGK